ncbi:DUF4238 domain-containing protein [Anatilimnocola floriformis]|uniref:DUF4238 domain-containing protein n=1 Tax=Anatilimnocola floriformis TaxID=2948575 RepID=UPI0020C57FF4|nr:DUF4238 domain-containing protein [Anatilimnocola floriformis]
MGDHYVPREHLKRFSENAECKFVWMYDKQSRRSVRAGISAVANEVDYYPDEVERELAIKVEAPGAECVRKLIRNESLTTEERFQFSFYMFTMATRGPRRRRQVQAMSSDVLASTITEVREVITQGSDPEKVAKRLKELDQVEAQFNAALPQELQDGIIRTPFTSPSTVGAVFQMTWNICKASNARFVTGDTPAHFFPSLGVGRPNSEFTFPLSTSHALIGQHLGINKVIYRDVNQRDVKEVNRRILSQVERFAFSEIEEPWIDTVVQKRFHHESLIRWK